MSSYTSPAAAFQQAVVAALDASLDLAGVTITAHPRPDEPLPYIALGNGDRRDDVDDPWLMLEVHTWSATEGPHGVHELQRAVYSALHSQTIELGAWRFVNIREEYATHFLDIGGEVWHGVQRLRTLSSQL